ncbi:MAG: hypothetical protein LBD75_07505 [Candidatus Peribacteria bacterium]|nr:hypothetical protein [Candidatus Peribacteria bacterium]
MGSKIVGENGKVFAIEPSSQNYAELEKNIFLNKDMLPDNISSFKVGAGKTETSLTIYYDNQGNPGATTLIKRV